VLSLKIMSNPEKPSIKRKQCVGFDMH